MRVVGLTFSTKNKSFMDKNPLTACMGQKSGVKFKWSCNNRSLLISQCIKGGPKSKKELPEAKKVCMAWQEIWDQAFQNNHTWRVKATPNHN